MSATVGGQSLYCYSICLLGNIHWPSRYPSTTSAEYVINSAHLRSLGVDSGRHPFRVPLGSMLPSLYSLRANQFRMLVAWMQFDVRSYPRLDGTKLHVFLALLVGNLHPAPVTATEPEVFR